MRTKSLSQVQHSLCLVSIVGSTVGETGEFVFVMGVRVRLCKLLCRLCIWHVCSCQGSSLLVATYRLSVFVAANTRVSKRNLKVCGVGQQLSSIPVD